MKRALSFGLSLLVMTTWFSLNASAAPPNRPLATITGSVRDNKGNPVAGALVTLFRDGVKRAIKETFTDAQGNFATKVSPGRYGIKAIANGFTEVVFASVEVRASQELIYRFNLEPVGSGNTLPERRRDRDDVKWTLRSAQSRRSIFQAQEGDDPTVDVVTATEDANKETATTATNLSERSNEDSKVRPRGVVESYVSSSSFTPAYAGLNFAVATPISEHVELVFAGQTGVGPYAPERFEASTKLRVGNSHQIGLPAAGARLPAQPWLGPLPNSNDVMGQVSLRAIDEWIVRDGIVIVLGLDYSRFVGHGGDRAVTPRFGIQYDANARTRVKAAFASA